MCGPDPLAFLPLAWGFSAARRIRPGSYTRQPRPQAWNGRAASTRVWSQRLFHDRLSLDATYFYNRFYDLMVTLGGSLSRLGRFQTDTPGQLAGPGRGVRGQAATGAMGLRHGIGTRA